MLDLIILGTHSDGFQAPELEPAICPIRTITGLSVVFSATLADTLSHTQIVACTYFSLGRRVWADMLRGSVLRERLPDGWGRPASTFGLRVAAQARHAHDGTLQRYASGGAECVKHCA